MRDFKDIDIDSSVSFGIRIFFISLFMLGKLEVELSLVVIIWRSNKLLIALK